MMTAPIQLIDINSELNRLWNSEQGQKKTRASLFNLILFVQKAERADYFKTLIKSVVSKFPCRVILIISDETPREEYLRTSVTSETIGTGDQQIYCELIQIEVAGKLIERVPFIILPQILPDLPVYLLWTQDPSTESQILPHLEPLANRIIFDPESTHQLQRYCQSVLSLSRRFHCQIGDLNWSAISGWRKILAEVFDAPQTLLCLAESKLLKIYYNRPLKESYKHAEVEGAYLLGWCASRLGWKFHSFESSEGNVRISFQRPTTPLTALLIPQEVASLPTGAILAFEVEGGENQDHFSFKRHPQTRQVFVQHSDKQCCDLPYCTYLAGIEEGKEIVEEIFYPSGGAHYLEMLDLLSSIPWSH